MKICGSNFCLTGRNDDQRRQAHTEKAENRIRFQGQYEDVETGLFYNFHRYYDPGAGRYINKDPIGLIGGLNHYVYEKNPINWVDPLGLDREKVLNDALDVLRSHDAQIREVFGDDVRYGIKGSLATGFKYTGGGFDPDDFDVDAFIVNKNLGKNVGREYARQHHLDYEIARVYNNKTRRSAIVVTFRGNYWEENKKPQSNNEPLIRYVVAQAVMWPPSPGRGIVVDLSGLEYTYGDELLSWASLLRRRLIRNQDYKLALVWGEKNKDAIKSLMEDSDETELPKTSFDRLEDAISYICD